MVIAQPMHIYGQALSCGDHTPVGWLALGSTLKHCPRPPLATAPSTKAGAMGALFSHRLLGQTPDMEKAADIANTAVQLSPCGSDV